MGQGIDVSAKVTALQETIAEERAGKDEVSLKDCFKGTNLQRTMISMVRAMANLCLGLA